MRGLNLKKVITTAMLVFGFMVLVPTTVEAKTKTLTYNINKTTADKFCKDIQDKGTDAHFLGKDKDKYKIVLTVKASSVKDGRAKVKKFATKVMNADSNKYGLSYGVRYDDYNTEKYDAKKKIYTTRLYNTANDIYYLNAITGKALKDVDYWQRHYVKNIIVLIPESQSFKKLSESAKTEFLLEYMGQNLMNIDSDGNRVDGLDYKGMPFTWKNLFYNKQAGVCADYAKMYSLALRLIAYDYSYQEEINWAANHEVLLARVKNSKGDFDYFTGNNGTFYAYDANTYNSNATIKSTDFAAWQNISPKEYKVTKLEKAAYKYGKAKTKSDLYYVLYK